MAHYDLKGSKVAIARSIDFIPLLLCLRNIRSDEGERQSVNEGTDARGIANRVGAKRGAQLARRRRRPQNLSLVWSRRGGTGKEARVIRFTG